GDRLEVEEAQAADHEGPELAGQGPLDDEAVLGHRLELAPLGDVELLVLRQLLDGRDAAREVGGGLFRPDAGEVPDVVQRVGPAAAHERALARLEAVSPNRNVGERRSEEHTSELQSR